MVLSFRAAQPAMKFWLIDEMWRLYTAGRRRKQGTVAIVSVAIATNGPSGHCRADLL
jgi:hypothetical protein